MFLIQRSPHCGVTLYVLIEQLNCFKIGLNRLNESDFFLNVCMHVCFRLFGFCTIAYYIFLLFTNHRYFEREARKAIYVRFANNVDTSHGLSHATFFICHIPMRNITKVLIYGITYSSSGDSF